MEQYQPWDMPVIDLNEHIDEDGRGLDLVELSELQEKAAREWLEDRTLVLDAENILTSEDRLKTIKSIVIAQF
jgi:hypothetical protein